MKNDLTGHFHRFMASLVEMSNQVRESGWCLTVPPRDETMTVVAGGTESRLLSIYLQVVRMRVSLGFSRITGVAGGSFRKHR